MSETTLPAHSLQAHATNTASVRRLPNAFDLAAFAFIAAGLIVVSHAARHTFAPLEVPQSAPIHLDPAYLPGYALRTVMRMFAALAASLVFTLVFSTFAAKSRRAGLVLIPVLDILQSLPIFGFLTFTVTFFLGLFPGQVIGAELAVIFVIFTSQAWNMAFSMFQSLTTVPGDLDEATTSFGLSPWQRFWRLEVPFAIPGLVWNMMMSMSGGWFMLVVSEAVTVGNTTFQLPGIGSYIAAALEAKSMRAVVYAIVAMLVVILAYDQLLFRPLVAWSGKFRFETTQVEQGGDPWVLALLRRTRLLRFLRCGAAPPLADGKRFAGHGFFVLWRAWPRARLVVREDFYVLHGRASRAGRCGQGGDSGRFYHDARGGADDAGDAGVGAGGRFHRAAPALGARHGRGRAISRGVSRQSVLSHFCCVDRAVFAQSRYLADPADHLGNAMVYCI